MMEARLNEVGRGVMGAKPIRFDTSRYPLVVVTFAAEPTSGEFGRYLAQLDELLARGAPYAIVLDSSRSVATPALHRKLQADWMRDNRQALTQLSLGCAFILTSPLVRGALTAILWMQPMPQPYTVVATMAEAEAWALERLRARGLVVPKKPG